MVVTHSLLMCCSFFLNFKCRSDRSLVTESIFLKQSALGLYLFRNVKKAKNNDLQIMFFNNCTFQELHIVCESVRLLNRKKAQRTVWKTYCIIFKAYFVVRWNILEVLIKFDIQYLRLRFNIYLQINQSKQKINSNMYYSYLSQNKKKLT